MAQGRYQFEGQLIQNPGGDYTGGNIGNEITNLIGMEKEGLTKRWQLEDEGIQLDLLKGAAIPGLFDRYMALSAEAGASGDELASVTFQQKAYMLQQQAARGSGGGGGSGRASGASVKAESDFQKDWEKLVKEKAAQYDQDNRELYKGAVTGFVKTKDNKYIPISPEDAIDSILKNMEQYQTDVVGLADKYKDYLYGGKNGNPVTGWSDVKTAIDNELGLAIKGSKAGQGIKMFDAFFNDVLGEPSKSDVTPVNKFYDQVYSRVIAGYDDKGNPVGNPNFVLAYIPPETDKRTGLSGGTNGLFSYQWIDKNEAMNAGYVPVSVKLDDGRTRVEYHRPLNYDTFSDGTDQFGQFAVPSFSKDGKFEGMTPLSFMNNKWYNSVDPTAQGVSEATMDENGFPSVFANKASQANVMKFTGVKSGVEGLTRSPLDMRAKQPQTIQDQVSQMFGLDRIKTPQQGPMSQAPADLLRGLTQNASPAPQNFQSIMKPQISANPLQDLVSKFKPQTAANPFAGVKSGVEGTQDLASVINARFGKPQTPQAPQSRAPIAGPVAAPLRNFKTGVGGSVVPVSPEVSRQSNPLNIRRQAADAAMQGFRAFQNFFKKIGSFF